jgi:hypothetical protein
VSLAHLSPFPLIREWANDPANNSEWDEPAPFSKKEREKTWRRTFAVLSIFEKAGAVIDEAKIPESFEFGQDAHRVIMRAEAASYHKKLLAIHRGTYRPKIPELTRMGMESPAPFDLFSTGDPSFQIPWSLGGFPTIGSPSGLSPQGVSPRNSTHQDSFHPKISKNFY